MRPDQATEIAEGIAEWARQRGDPELVAAIAGATPALGNTVRNRSRWADLADLYAEQEAGRWVYGPQMADVLREFAAAGAAAVPERAKGETRTAVASAGLIESYNRNDPYIGLGELAIKAGMLPPSDTLSWGPREMEDRLRRNPIVKGLLEEAWARFIDAQVQVITADLARRVAMIAKDRAMHEDSSLFLWLRSRVRGTIPLSMTHFVAGEAVEAVSKGVAKDFDLSDDDARFDMRQLIRAHGADAPPEDKGYREEDVDMRPATEGEAYFVTARDGEKWAALLGPFETHREALEQVGRGRTLTWKHFAGESGFVGFGTARAPRGTVTRFSMDGAVQDVKSGHARESSHAFTAAEKAIIAADFIAPDPLPGVPGPPTAAVLARHAIREAADVPGIQTGENVAVPSITNAVLKQQLAAGNYVEVYTTTKWGTGYEGVWVWDGKDLVKEVASPRSSAQSGERWAAWAKADPGKPKIARIVFNHREIIATGPQKADLSARPDRPPSRSRRK